MIVFVFHGEQTIEMLNTAGANPMKHLRVYFTSNQLILRAYKNKSYETFLGKLLVKIACKLKLFVCKIHTIQNT